MNACTAFVLGLVLGLPVLPAWADEPVTEERTWTEVYPVTGAEPWLVISNIWGNVTVTAGMAGQITATVHEVRTAPDQSRFERSHESIYLEVDADPDGVSMLVGGPDRYWRRFDRCRGCRVDYQFEIAVPPDTRVDVGTVTDGRVDISGIRGPVTASNVNGPIDLESLHDCELIENVNGRIDLHFANVPGGDCSIETVNGDITMGLPDGTGMDMAFDLFNGRMVSEMDVDPLAMPATVERMEADGRFRYRIEQPAGVRLGAGGPRFTFSSLNGDIRIRRNQ